MLSVENTAREGVVLSIPSVVTRQAEPYLAIRAAGPMAKLPDFAPPLFPRLHQWMADNAIASGMSGFFRYRRFFGADVELEVGTTTLQPATGGGEVIAGELPAGRYAHAVHTGPYDRLYDAFLMMEGWMGGRGLTPAGRFGPDGARPDCQIEIYRVTPMHETDPALWKTEILVKLVD
ncbi:GyrI-like domain-containing protein [Oricola sp.]|uniref:GyrI-like domain-containing protein n=1 Tax=Oricola sp. TaxID=1979950 RepID=UPI0025F08CE8|nr:GyrI-like domain-containing protein [Oricola sp.]MCI5077704.1 GyrI-like domain-containing protein [Oricola sp.]